MAPGPLIRPPTKRQVAIGAIAGGVAIGIMALAGSTGTSSDEVARERAAAAAAGVSAAPSAAQTVASAGCRDIVRDLTKTFFPAQDALNEAAESADFAEADLETAADQAKIVEKGDELADCERADPDAADVISAGLDAVQDAADEPNLSKREAQGYLESVEELLALAK